MKRPATMRTVFLPKNWQRGLLCCLSGTALLATAADEPSPEGALEKYFGLHKVSPEEDDWTRHLRLGAMVGLNLHAGFKESGSLNVSGNNPAAGIYDNGYVLTDATGNAGGGTSYWGYNNASQYDAANHQLKMLGSSGFTAADGGANVNDAGSVGFDMAYGGNLWYWRHVRIGWEAGFGLLPLHIVDNRSLTASINQSLYTFSTLSPDGSDIVVPTAPYQGGASGQGPLIQYPSTFPNGVPQSPTLGTVTGKRELDVILYTLRLGATFYGDVSENIGVSFGAGPAIGLVSGNYRYDEVITVNNGGTGVHNQGGFGSTEVVFGGYVNATVMYHFKDAGRDADVYLSAEYMPMSDATMSRQGREGRLDLSGQIHLSIGLNWPF